MIEKSSTGRRPYLSDKAPRIGEKISCITEYEAKRSPTMRGLALKVVPSAYKGRTGITMPNPTRSMKTVVKITTSGERFMTG
jgi:hypothetical protein